MSTTSDCLAQGATTTPFAPHLCLQAPGAQHYHQPWAQMGTAHKGHPSLGKTKAVINNKSTPASPGCWFHTDFWYVEKEGRGGVETCSDGDDFCGAGTQSSQEAALASARRLACSFWHVSCKPQRQLTNCLGSKCLTCFMNWRRDRRFCSQYFGSSSALGYFTQPNSMVTSKQFVFK